MEIRATTTYKGSLLPRPDPRLLPIIQIHQSFGACMSHRSIRLILAVVFTQMINVSVCMGNARADLGEAEIGIKSLEYDAFCATRGNKCTVSFSSSSMIVNKKDGITRAQILRIWEDQELRGFWDRSPGNYYHPVYYVTYKKANGEDATAKFLFINAEAGARFWNSLNIFMGPDRRPVGPSIKVVN